METLTLYEYVDLLRERLFDYEAVHHDGSIPDFEPLMKDQDYAPEGWVMLAYEELEAQGHLHPDRSGLSGDGPCGLLSADGRAYVLEHRAEQSED